MALYLTIDGITYIPMKKASTLFYSVLSVFLVLEFLLTCWSLAGNSFSSAPVGAQLELPLRITVLLFCLASLAQIYFLHVKGTRLTSLRYWLLLAVGSATTVYHKYMLPEMPVNQLMLGKVLYFVSFFCWILLLVLGVGFQTMHQSRYQTGSTS